MSIPSDFDHRPLLIRHVPAAALLRIFKTPAGFSPAPLYYSRESKFRFDCPSTADTDVKFGVTYAAFDLATCFVETVTRSANHKPLQAGRIPINMPVDIEPRHVARLDAKLPLMLADATDIGLYRLGAEGEKFNSTNYAVHTQPWALQIYKRPEAVHGLIYRSRFLNGREAVAIFERGARTASLIATQTVPLVRHPDFPKVLDELRISLL